MKKIFKFLYYAYKYNSHNILTKQKAIQSISVLSEFHRYGVNKPYELQRYAGFTDLLLRTKDVEGDIVECGVGRGKSLFYLGYLTKMMNTGKHIYGFDSFEGFPEPTKEDSSHRQPKKGDWSVANMSLVKNRYAFANEEDFYQKNVKLVKGFFNETISKNLPEMISFLHLDADLYQSTKDVIEHAYGKLSQGAIVVLDEYADPKWPGVEKAMKEFMIDKSEKIDYFDLIGKYGFIKD